MFMTRVIFVVATSLASSDFKACKYQSLAVNARNIDKATTANTLIR